MNKSHANYKEKMKCFKFIKNIKDMFKLIDLEELNDVYNKLFSI
jgi:hypothetical protein